MLAGRAFIAGRPIGDVLEYTDWLQNRQGNLLRLGEVFQEVVIGEFPAKVFSTSAREASPQEILKACDSITRLFADSVELEREASSVQPPEGFEKLHSLQIGWSTPFRDAVKQLIVRLQTIVEIDPEANEAISLVVDLGEVPNVDEFNQELGNRLKSFRAR